MEELINKQRRNKKRRNNEENANDKKETKRITVRTKIQKKDK